MRYNGKEDCTDGLRTGFFLEAIGVGEDGGCAVACDVCHEWVWNDAEEYECCVGDFVGEEEKYGEDEDDVTVGKEDVCETLDQGAYEKPCCDCELVSEELATISFTILTNSW